jgi:hypothetical protein
MGRGGDKVLVGPKLCHDFWWVQDEHRLSWVIKLDTSEHSV